jgi:hypothetical protein
VPALLFLALLAVYALGVSGIVVAESVLGDNETPADLETRLAAVRAASIAKAEADAAADAAGAAPYFVRAGAAD